MQKKIFFFLRIFVTFAIFFALFKFIPYSRIVQVYKNSHKLLIVSAFLIFWLSLLLGIIRWKFLLSAVGANISFRETFYSYFSGLFLNLFFPSFVAGDVFRSFGISRRHGKPTTVASTVLMDRFCGGLALTLVAVISYLFLKSSLKQKQILFCLLALAVIVLFLFLIIFSRKFFTFLLRVVKKKSGIYKRLASFHNQLYFFKENPIVFYKTLTLSLIIQLLMPIGFFVGALAFGLTLSPVVFLVLVPIITAAAFIPITIAGAGTREALVVYFLSVYGVAEPIGLGISLINLLFLISSSILGGIFYVTVYHRWLQHSS